MTEAIEAPTDRVALNPPKSRPSGPDPIPPVPSITPTPPAAAETPSAPPEPRWIQEAALDLFRPSRKKGLIVVAAGSLVAGAVAMNTFFGRTSEWSATPTAREAAAAPKPENEPPKRQPDATSAPSESPALSVPAPPALLPTTVTETKPAATPMIEVPALPIPTPSMPIMTRNEPTSAVPIVVPSFPGEPGGTKTPAPVVPSLPANLTAPLIPVVAEQTTPAPSIPNIPTLPSSPSPAPAPIPVAIPSLPMIDTTPAPTPVPVPVPSIPGVVKSAADTTTPMPVVPSLPFTPTPVPAITPVPSIPETPKIERRDTSPIVITPTMTETVPLIPNPSVPGVPPAIETRATKTPDVPAFTPNPTLPSPAPVPTPTPTPLPGVVNEGPRPTLVPVQEVGLKPLKTETGEAPRTDFDVDLHEPRANDTYESISKVHYNDAKFATALRAFNRGVDPRGATIQIPPLYILRQKFATFIQPVSATEPAGGASKVERGVNWEPVGEKPAADVSTYTIAREGMTLWDVADDVYGDRKNWNRIYDANPRFDPNERLPIGTKLTLPLDARKK